MTSETEVLKTNEFLRRRKLRIQQVREQSKEIAKKIRQRAKVEKFRHIVDLDEKKQKEYFEHQDKLIKKLEHYYANGLRNVGAGHRNASYVNLQVIPEQTDPSQKRGKEATAELRRKKQEKLDEQKKLLDRKLQARETANEISREKTSTVASKLLAKSSSKVDDTGKSSSDFANKNTDNTPEQIPNRETVEGDKTNQPQAVTTDMATQWDFEELPNEWEPKIPKLVLPKDDKDSPKETPHKHGESKSEKSKRLNLFALSTDMPSSLRGGLTSVPEENIPVKSSVTLVSEYLQSRGLRLRESDSTVHNKKGVEDLQSIKQTILRTRSSRNEVKESHAEKPSKTTEAPSVSKKNSMMMYNHSTRDTRDIPRGDRLVIRDPQTEEDAYSQAMKESSDNKDREYQKKFQDMRTKIAMTKQNVEKEYKDTMAFLSSLPKDKSKPIKSAYMDDERQKMQKESRQWKLQQEFKKIEKDCRKNAHMNPTISTHNKSLNKSKSPSKFDSDDELNGRDFQYSWMPVPDSDGSLAIHTIPTTLKENNKFGNSVKFSKVDSYHEYRSRHRHTPPTKDNVAHERNSNKRVVEAVVIEQEDNESTENSSIASDTSSVPPETDKKARRNKDGEERLSDAERIIIYKILDSKIEKKDKGKTNSRLIKDYAKSLTSIDKERILKYMNAAEDNAGKVDKQRTPNLKRTSRNAETRVSFEQLNEGIYRTVNENGDNINSLHMSESPRNDDPPTGADGAITQYRLCVCGKKLLNRGQKQNVDVHRERGDDPSGSRFQSTSDQQPMCSCDSRPNSAGPAQVPQATDSNYSYKTARTNKTNVLKEGEFIELLDEGGKEARKFYIGATGFLQDNAYEVVIQLRKKDTAKDDRKESETQAADGSVTPINATENLVKEKPDTVIATEATDADIKAGDKTRVSVSVGKQLEMESYDLQTQNLPVSEEPVDCNVMRQEQMMNSNRASSDMAVEEQFSQTNDLVDKCVYTTFKLPYAVPSTVTKCDSVPRRATSTYTQTTGLGSPDQRPVFLHMSSSTSTTYMSPPEMILPHFLKNDYKISYDERNTVQGDRLQSVDKEYCEEYSGYRRRRCTHSGKVMTKSPPRMNSSPRINLSNYRGTTPPNTARSNITEHGSNKTGTINSVSKTRKCKCRKCESRSESKICHKAHSHKSKQHLATNRRPSRNHVMRININKKTASSDYNVRKVTLNPAIKSYVDRLLALNKEGLRAIEVMNQECSSATTPGSSIIDDPRNQDRTKPVLENKISLEQMKVILTQKLLEKFEQRKNSEQSDMGRMDYSNAKRFTRNPRKKLHKVKSLNISKHLFKAMSSNVHEHEHKVKYRETVSSSSSTNTRPNSKKSMPPMSKSRSKSSHSPRKSNNALISQNPVSTTAAHFTKVSVEMGNANYNKTTTRSDSEIGSSFIDCKKKSDRNHPPEITLPARRAAVTSSESEDTGLPVQRQTRPPPLIASTQTSSIIDEEIKFMKLAEDKLQNMEKIADLTEKCTKRLSNLAKVLEEVRRNKSLAYSQISDSTSDSDLRSDRNLAPNKQPAPSSIFEIRKDSSIEHEKHDTEQNKPTAESDDSVFEIKNITSSENQKSANARSSTMEIHDPITEKGKATLIEDRRSDRIIVPTKSQSLSDDSLIETKSPVDPEEPQKSPYDVLLDIRKEMADTGRMSDINVQSKPVQSYEPLETKKADSIKAPPSTPKGKPENLKNSSISPEYVSYLTDIPTLHTSKSHISSDTQTAVSNNLSEEHNVRNRGKPPPALTRIHLKQGQDFIVPHELSTVVEVDSPLSLKFKNHSARDDNNYEYTASNSNKDIKKSYENNPQVNPDLLQSNVMSIRQKVSSTDSSDDSKMQMMDLKQFKEIMLKPFISVQEYARQCNVSALDDGSNIDNLPKDDVVNDELGSLHSDGSFPDVIAELLKRNIISEPFKFESGSNVNSSVSSESTLSVLALSKMRKEKKKSSLMSQNKENIIETSDTLSVSSNPDLENAFKKLGMGWASSTLKKTKERLALSSSSNTSSSSMSQFKIKSFKNIPVLISDSVSSALDMSDKSPQRKPATDILQRKQATEIPKNAEQQTSLVNSMTVKEFLKNELAKKITFTNRSRRSETEEEFVSLHETRMPEQMKQMVCEERSMDSGPSGSNNRARTSTPVQIFKSLTYHSSSSSNMSNGLFSNVDELSSVKGTSTSMRNHSTSDKDDLTIPNYSLRIKKGLSDCSKSD